MNLRVLTYNVFGMPWGLQSIESILLWALYDTDAEILCFQEVFSIDHRRRIEELCARTYSQWNCWFPQTQSNWLSLWPSFASITGLCILTKKEIEILEEPVFQPFDRKSNVDKWVQKGFFHIHCKKDGFPFHLITTHFQSDFTECKLRIRYEEVRANQEHQLYHYCKSLSSLVLIGDFNTQQFNHFCFVNSQLEPTLQETGESLDHCLCLPHSLIYCDLALYFHSILLSDHTPVLFHLRFGEA